MKSRVEQFEATAALEGELQDVALCVPSFWQWMVSAAAAWAARGVPALPAPAANSQGQVLGLDDFCRAAQIPCELVEAMGKDMEREGAVHVRELTAADWGGLPSWSQLRPLQQRRVLAALGSQ